MTWIARMAKIGTVVIGTLGLGASAGALTGCGSPPSTPASQSAFVSEADATLAAMRATSSNLDDVLDQAYGYAVFPRIGKGGLIVGGAHGDGVVYRGGVPIGLVELNQASIGAQLGGQTFSEIIIFKSAGDLEELMDGRFSLGANASVAVLDRGAAAAIEFQDGVAVVVKPRAGLMVDLSVSGQNLNYKALRPPRG